MLKHVLVTGGWGFIGSNLVRDLIAKGIRVTVWDAHTYAARPGWVHEFIAGHSDREHLLSSKRVHLGAFGVASIVDLLEADFPTPPDAIFHLAAESHVCNSIADPMRFFESNVMGTATLLEALRRVQYQNPFIHVSTDEVFGELTNADPPFTINTPYRPRSPYAASKAASDHVARSYHETYGMDVRVTNCSNNYGPNQDWEKLIPRTIRRLLAGEEMTIYGTGKQVRDWIHVLDHTAGLHQAWVNGHAGQTYLFGGNCERTNMEMIEAIWRSLCRVTGRRVELRMTHTDDRPSDDFRYAIDTRNTSGLLRWAPQRILEDGLDETVAWFADRLDRGEEVTRA